MMDRHIKKAIGYPDEACPTWLAWPLYPIRDLRIPHFGSSRMIGAKRDGNRRSAGVDIRAREGDLVRSPMCARVIGYRPWWQSMYMIYLRDGDGVWGLGGVHNVCVSVGDNVQTEQDLALICRNFLHVEAYDFSGGQHRISDEGVMALICDGHLRWYGKRPPIFLRDPTTCLLQASELTKARWAIHDAC